MQTEELSSPWARRLTALLALAVLVLFLSPVALLADPPDEDDPPPPPMTETHVAAEAEAAAAVAAIQPVLREAQALLDRMPQNVSGDIQLVFTPEHFQRYTNRVESRREAAEKAMESHRDGNLTEDELAVKLAQLELNAYETVFDAIQDHMRLEGAVLSATTGKADWWVGAWIANRSAEDIEKEKQQLAALITLAEQLIAIRERVVQQRFDLRIQMMRIVRRVEAYDELAAQEMAYEVERRFRESYIDHSVERASPREFNLQLRNCKVWGPQIQTSLHYIDAFIAPNLLARARVRLQLIEEGRAPRRRMSVSITDAQGTAHDGRVVSPGMTVDLVFENEGSLVSRQSLSIGHYRDNAPLIGSALPLLYMDPQRALDEGYARRIGRRGEVHLESLYLSNKILFITEDQADSEEVRIARAKRWSVLVVEPGDVIWITGEGFATVELGVEPAQTVIRLFDVATHAIVPLEEMRYGVSYKLEIILGQRQEHSDLRYEIAWGEGRFDRKVFALIPVPNNNSELTTTNRLAGYTHFRSREPIVFEDTSLIPRPGRNR